MTHHRVAYLVLVSSFVGGCAIDPGTTSDGLSVFPSTTLYSGAETGAAKYSVTIAASGATGVTWTSLNPSIATVTGTDRLGTITSLEAGSTLIRVSGGGKTIEVPLIVNRYASSDRMAGGETWASTCSRSGCHDAQGPDVSPSGIGKHTDAEVQTVFTTGINPEGGEVVIGAAQHSWPIKAGTPAYVGMVAFLRSLPPGTPHPDE